MSTQTMGLQKELSRQQKMAVSWFHQWMQSAGYSENTIKTYLQMLRTFWMFTGAKDIRSILEQDVLSFNSDYILRTKKSESYQRQAINAIKLFYKQIGDHRLDLGRLRRAPKRNTLPMVLSLVEVKSLLGAYNNLKHKCIVAITYACGLRRSEVQNLRWKDIDRSRMLLYVRLGKGKKDRQVILPIGILNLLEEYYRSMKAKPGVFVFEGAKGKQYSATSMAKLLKAGLKRAGIKKNATLHTLRHSYATHVHEQGTDIYLVQKLLGHQSSKTTEIYIHLSKRTLHDVKNPFDEMSKK